MVASGWNEIVCVRPSYTGPGYRMDVCDVDTKVLLVEKEDVLSTYDDLEVQAILGLAPSHDNNTAFVA